MITIVGTAHVFNLSPKISGLIDTLNPDAIALELDPARYQALLTPEFRKKRKGPLFFMIMERIQRSIAHSFGTEAGNEMITAGVKAQQLQIPLFFIDLDIRELSARLQKEISLREKLRFLLPIFTAIFLRKKTEKDPIKDLQENEEMYISQLSKKFPALFKILVQDRNSQMIQRLYELTGRFNNILVVVGDAHVSGIASSFKECRAIRLHDIMAMEFPNNQIRFVVNYKIDEQSCYESLANYYSKS